MSTFLSVRPPYLLVILAAAPFAGYHLVGLGLGCMQEQPCALVLVTQARWRLPDRELYVDRISLVGVAGLGSRLS